METAIAHCVELIKWAASPIIRRINHLKELEHNMELLKHKKEELDAKESDIISRLQRAGEKRKQPLQEVKVWLKRVKITKDEVNNIERSLDQEEMIARNYFSKFYSRIKLAERVVDQIDELKKLKDENFPEGFVGDAPDETDVRAETATLFDPPSLSSKPTAEETMDEIMDLLLNAPEIGKIGVYGMGGIGKTTIMMNINNKLTETRHFDKIIWVTVSKEIGDIQVLQNKIAKQLGGDFSKELSSWEDMVMRATMLSEKLKQAKRFLIILDDLWEKVTLQEVGIPQPNKDNNCKVLVTTRCYRFVISLKLKRTLK